MTLICCDWSILVEQCLWAFNDPEAAPSGKERICIFIQTNAKIKFSQVCARSKWAGNMQIFHVDVKMKRLGNRFKNNSFQWFRVKSFFILYRCTFRFKTLQDVFIHLEPCYTLHERSSSKIHNRGNFKKCPGSSKLYNGSEWGSRFWSPKKCIHHHKKYSTRLQGVMKGSEAMCLCKKNIHI